MVIRDVAASDMQQIADIYNHYIHTTTISFEELSVSAEQMRDRVQAVLDIALPWLVAELDGKVIGYAYAGQWKARSAYRYTVEPSIYLDHSATGKGAGRRLYSALFEQLKVLGISNAVGSIALPNPSSIGLHESLGFKKVGEFSNIGMKFGKKISVGYWQLELSA